MYILVCGSRSYSDYGTLSSILDLYDIDEIIHGGCRGADTLADRYARDKGVAVTIFPAHWQLYGKGAGLRRNGDMVKYLVSKQVEECDVIVLAFDPSGPGTKSTVNLATKSGLKVIVY
jgi:hypothetical protein